MLRRQRGSKPIKPWQGAKPKLPMQIVNLCRVHYLDLEVYLAKVYQMYDYDLLLETGAIGICPEYTVTGEMPAAANVNQQADNIRRGRVTWNLGLILNVLCQDGFIPQGQYVIDTKVPPSLIGTYTNLLNQHQDPSNSECVAFRRRHRDPGFQRRVKILDKRARDYHNESERQDECT